MHHRQYQETRIAPDFEQWRDEIKAAVNKIEEGSDYHVCLYTDGGCRPAPRGIGGWGIHGYIYHTTRPKIGHGCKGFSATPRGYVNHVDVDTDDKKETEVSVIHYIDACGSVTPSSTNNEAEVYGVLHALQLLKEIKPKTAHFKLDSRYALDTVQGYLDEYAKNNWRKSSGEEVKNAGVWKQVHVLLKEVLEHTSLSWEWVKGHSDSVGNTQADYMATSGVNSGRNHYQYYFMGYHIPKGYWGPDVDYSRFITERYWYFLLNHSGLEIDIHREAGNEEHYYLYHQGNHGPDDDYYGKPQAEAYFSIIALKQRDPVLESLREYQNVIDSHSWGKVICGRLDNITRPKVYKEISERGTHWLFKPAEKMGVENPADLILTREMTPTMRALFAARSLETLENVFVRVLNGLLPGTLQDPMLSQIFGVAPPRYRLTDITEVIYEPVRVKKADILKVRIEAGSDHMVIYPVLDYTLSNDAMDTTAVALTLGQDLPTRNFFASIAEKKPKVYALTYPEPGSDHGFRFATIVASDEAIGIWAGVYSNLWIIPTP